MYPQTECTEFSNKLIASDLVMFLTVMIIISLILRHSIEKLLQKLHTYSSNLNHD